MEEVTKMHMGFRSILGGRNILMHGCKYVRTPMERLKGETIDISEWTDT